MTETYAKIIEDSVSPEGHRLTTMEVRFHRFVLAEFNTHRVFSRNSASSRAIPVAKQLARVKESPAWPVSWPAEQKGMQGGEEFSEAEIENFRGDWEYAIEEATYVAELLARHGLHKSVTNRLLEPFMWHTVVVTSTAWDNFFALRCNPMAQPEIRVAAEEMKAAYDASTPRVLGAQDWHLPYMDWETADDAQYDPKILVKVSSARCARVSYLTQDGKRDIAKDLELYDRLVSATPMHASPLEHVATPNAANVDSIWVRNHLKPGETGHRILRLPRYGNFLGWHQHRFDVEIERAYQAFS